MKLQLICITAALVATVVAKGPHYARAAESHAAMARRLPRAGAEGQNVQKRMVRRTKRVRAVKRDAIDTLVAEDVNPTGAWDNPGWHSHDSTWSGTAAATVTSTTTSTTTAPSATSTSTSEDSSSSDYDDDCTDDSSSADDSSDDDDSEDCSDDSTDFSSSTTSAYAAYASATAAYTQAYTTSTAAAAVAKASSSLSTTSATSATYTGTATFFYQNGVAGACGNVNSDDAKVVALDSAIYNNGEYCGKTVVLTNTDTGESVTATVADECPSCESAYSVDLSVGAFTALASESAGVFPLSWYFAD